MYVIVFYSLQSRSRQKLLFRILVQLDLILLYAYIVPSSKLARDQNISEAKVKLRTELPKLITNAEHSCGKHTILRQANEVIPNINTYSRTVRSTCAPCGPVMYFPALLAARFLGQPRAFTLSLTAILTLGSRLPSSGQATSSTKV